MVKRANQTAKTPELETPKTSLVWPLIFILLGFNIGSFYGAFGIGFGVTMILSFIGVFLALPKTKQSWVSVVTVCIGSISALTVGMRANGFVQAMGYLTSLSSLGYLMFLVSVPQVPITLWEHISQVFLYAVQSIFSPFRLILQSREKDESDAQSRPLSIIKTAAITIAVFAVFATLLMSADPIFKQMVQKFVEELVGRIGWSLFLAIVFAGCLTVVLTDRKEKFLQLSALSVHDLLIPVSSLVGLFGLFLSVQGKYLFASHEIFRQFNITYSQYVREGFTQLLTASAIAAVISYFVIVKQRVSGQKVLTWINVALLLELILLLASAWRRDMMYIEVFGLTRMRIIGEVFLFWLLGGIILLLLTTIWKKVEEKHLMGGVALLSVCALTYFNTVNMDMRIVKTPPIRDGMVDLFYLANMSEDSAVSWETIVIKSEELFTSLKDKHSLSDEEKSRLTNAKLALYSLVAQREKLEKKYGPWDLIKKIYRDEIPKKPYEVGAVENVLPKDIRVAQANEWFKHHRTWQAYNASEFAAYTLMQQKRAVLFDRVDSLLYQLDAYQKMNYVDLAEQERWILYDFSYPYISIKTTIQPQYGRYPTPSPTPIPVRQITR